MNRLRVFGCVNKLKWKIRKNKKKKEECGIEYALEIKYVFMSHVKYILFSMCENKEKQCGME